MGKIAILLMIITVVSKILGFTRDIILSYFYGVSNISDAYLISLTIPITIFAFIGAGISTGYIPLYSKIEKKHGVEEGNRYTNNIVNILIIICTIIIIIGILFTDQVVKLFASGFEGEVFALAVKFTKISLFGIYFTGLIYLFNGFLQIKGNYAMPALIGFPLNIVTILSILLSSTTNVLVLSIGSVIASASQLILLIPFIYKKGYRYEFVLDIKDEHIKDMAYIALPVIIGVSANQLNVLVDKTLASSIAVGGISALSYANRLNEFVQGLFVYSIATVMYPMISRMSARNDMNGLKKLVLESINSIALLVIPATIGAMLFAEPIVMLLFGRGAFNPHAISMTSNALFYYSIGMAGFGLKVILSKAFFSLQDTKTPMINAAISMIVNVFLNFILSKYMGIGGLALATSISAIFCTGILFISFRKKVGPFGIKSVIISSIKVICAALMMGAISKLLYNLLIKHIDVNLSLIVSICIGAVTYFIIIYFMKIKEADVVINALKLKLQEK